MADLTPDEIAARDELVAAGLDPELATTIAQRQVALRKEKKESVRRERRATLAQRTKPALMDEVDYRVGGVGALTPLQRRAIEASLAIEAEDARSAGALGYMARALVIATLPYKHPKNPDGSPKVEYTRKNGDFTLRIVAGYEGGIPYGIHPRMLLSWIASEAVRKQSPIIELGDSLRQFLYEVLDVRSSSGGIRATSTMVLEQIKRLFGSMLTAVYEGQDTGRFALRNVLIANQLKLNESEMAALLTADTHTLETLEGDIYHALGETPKSESAETHLWTPQSPSEAGKWQSYVELSQAFYEECISSPVPLDLRAYRSLKASPMAMDIYAWLTHRMSYLRHTSRPIPWEMLLGQFGSGHTPVKSDPTRAVRDFKKAFLKALDTVLVVYPEAVLEPKTEGLVLHPSPTHIPKLQGPKKKGPAQPDLF